MDSNYLSQNKMKLRRFVFWPPFLLLVLAALLSLLNRQLFQTSLTAAHHWLLEHFGWLFTTLAFGAFVLSILISCSRFGGLRLGGRNAQPLMSMWNWFAITLCTTIAVGILFWSTAEPLMHFQNPPESTQVTGLTKQAETLAISALFLHWTFVPYSIYCVASLMFGFAYYNMRLPFTLGSTLVPLVGRRVAQKIGPVVDSVCLFSLVAGMAASLGTGILTISGGLNSLFGIERTPTIWAAITLIIVCTFIASSATGLMKGIRILSDINAKGLVVLGAIVFILGPTLLILQVGSQAVVEFAQRFFSLGIYDSLIARSDWTKQWSIFYWAVWMAWTPITACFLGRIAYGRTVREFMLINLWAPALFSMAWMAVWGVTTLNLEQNGANLAELAKLSGNESVSYAVLSSLPFGTLMVIFYLASAFICFVTSADSNTTAMSSISSAGVTLDKPEGLLWVKFAWGMLVGWTAWMMISFADVEGIKMLSNLGGFPAAWLIFGIMLSLALVVWNPSKYNLVDSEIDGPDKLKE